MVSTKFYLSMFRSDGFGGLVVIMLASGSRVRGFEFWIPEEWTLRPQFHIWPPRRHRAVLWIIAHMVWYRIQESRIPSAQEYLDFLRRVRWKAYQDTGRVNKVGNYLSILETTKSYLNGGARETSLRWATLGTNGSKE
jgi:hypothetical protein